MTLRIAFLLLITTLAHSALSHPGRTASDGCHYCRTNCESWGVPAGQRHCHNNAAPDSPAMKLSVVQIPDYDRDDWNHWIDSDKDCQNLRQELLIEQSLEPVTFTTRKDKKDCTVKTGKWAGIYTGNTYTKASDLDIDHMVPLNWAHLHGGWKWSKEEKEEFANDRENLLVVDDGENQTKSAQGPDTWLPPLNSYQCDYIRHFDTIVTKYELKYSKPEIKFLSNHKKCLSEKTANKLIAQDKAKKFLGEYEKERARLYGSTD